MTPLRWSRSTRGHSKIVFQLPLRRCYRHSGIPTAVEAGQPTRAGTYGRVAEPAICILLYFCFFVIPAFLAIGVIPFWFICNKAGFSPVAYTS